MRPETFQPLCQSIIKRITVALLLRSTLPMNLINRIVHGVFFFYNKITIFLRLIAMSREQQCRRNPIL